MDRAGQWDGLQQPFAALSDKDQELLDVRRRWEEERTEAEARGDRPGAREADEQLRRAQANINERVNALWSQYTETPGGPENLKKRIGLLERILRLDPDHAQAVAARARLQQQLDDEEAFVTKRERILKLRKAVQSGDVTGALADDVDRLYAEARGEALRRRIEEDPELNAAWGAIVEWRNTREGSERYSRFLDNMKGTYIETLNLGEEEWPLNERRPYGPHGPLSRGETLRAMAEEWLGHVAARVERDIALARTIGDPTTRLAALSAAMGHYSEWRETTRAEPVSQVRDLLGQLQQEMQRAEEQERAWREHQEAKERAARARTPLERYDEYRAARDRWLEAGGQMYEALERELQRAATELADYLAREVDPYLGVLATRIQEVTDRVTWEKVKRTYDQYASQVWSRDVDSDALATVRQKLGELSQAVAARERLVNAVEEIEQALTREDADLEELKDRLRELERQHNCSLKQWHNRIARREGLDEQLRLASRYLEDEGDFDNCLAALENADPRDARVLPLRQRAWLQRGLSLVKKRATWAQARGDLTAAARCVETEVSERAKEALAELDRLEAQQGPIDEVVAKVRRELAMANGGEPRGDNPRFKRAVASLRQVLKEQQGYLDEARELYLFVLGAWENRLRIVLDRWLNTQDEATAKDVGEALEYIRDDGQLLATESKDRNLVRAAELRLRRFSALHTPLPAGREERERLIAAIEQLLREDVDSLHDSELLQRLVRLCILCEQFDRARMHLDGLGETLAANPPGQGRNGLEQALAGVEELLRTTERMKELLDAYKAHCPRQGQGDDDWLTGHVRDCLALLENLPRGLDWASHRAFPRHVRDMCDRIAARIEKEAKAPTIDTVGLLRLLRRAVEAMRPLGNGWIAGLEERCGDLERRIAGWLKGLVGVWLAELTAYQRACQQSVKIEEAEGQCRRLLSDAEALGAPQEVQGGLRWLQDALALLEACHRRLCDLQRAYDSARQGGNLNCDEESAFRTCRRFIREMRALEDAFNQQNPASTIRLTEWREWQARLDSDLGSSVHEAELFPSWPSTAEEWRDLEVRVTRKGEVQHYGHLRGGYSQVLMLWEQGELPAFLAGAQKMVELDPEDRYSFARRFAMGVAEWSWSGEGRLVTERGRRVEGLQAARDYVQNDIIPNLQEWRRRKERVGRGVEQRTEPDDVTRSLEDRLGATMGSLEELRRLYGFPYPQELRERIERILCRLQRRYGLVGERPLLLAQDDGAAEDEPDLPREMRQSIEQAFRVLEQSLGEIEDRPRCLSSQARQIAEELYLAGSDEAGIDQAWCARAKSTFDKNAQAASDLLGKIERKWRLFSEFERRPDRPASAVREYLIPLREELEKLDLGDPAALEIIDMELPRSWGERLWLWLSRRRNLA